MLPENQNRATYELIEKNKQILEELKAEHWKIELLAEYLQWNDKDIENHAVGNRKALSFEDFETLEAEDITRAKAAQIKESATNQEPDVTKSFSYVLGQLIGLYQLALSDRNISPEKDKRILDTINKYIASRLTQLHRSKQSATDAIAQTTKDKIERTTNQLIESPPPQPVELNTEYFIQENVLEDLKKFARGRDDEESLRNLTYENMRSIEANTQSGVTLSGKNYIQAAKRALFPGENNKRLVTVFNHLKRLALGEPPRVRPPAQPPEPTLQNRIEAGKKLTPADVDAIKDDEELQSKVKKEKIADLSDEDLEKLKHSDTAKQELLDRFQKQPIESWDAEKIKTEFGRMGKTQKQNLRAEQLQKLSDEQLNDADLNADAVQEEKKRRELEEFRKKDPATLDPERDVRDRFDDLSPDQKQALKEDNLDKLPDDIINNPEDHGLNAEEAQKVKDRRNPPSPEPPPQEVRPPVPSVSVNGHADDSDPQLRPPVVVPSDNNTPPPPPSGSGEPEAREAEPPSDDFARQLKEILTSTEGPEMLRKLAGETGNERLWIDHRGKRIELKLSEEDRQLCRDILEGRKPLTDLLNKQLDLRARMDEVGGRTWKERWAADRRSNITGNLTGQWKTALESSEGLTVTQVCEDTANALQVQDAEKTAFITELTRLLTPFIAEGKIANEPERFWREFLTHARNALYSAEGWKTLEDVPEAQGIKLASKTYEQIKIRTWERVDEEGTVNKALIAIESIPLAVEPLSVNMYQQEGIWMLTETPITNGKHYFVFKVEKEGSIKTLYVDEKHLRICWQYRKEGNEWKHVEPRKFQLLILEKPSETPPEPPQPTQPDNPPSVAPLPPNSPPPAQPNEPPSVNTVDNASEWFVPQRERNRHDCGPCVLMNGLRFIGADNPPKNTQKIRKAINQLTHRNTDKLGDTEWLSDKDLHAFVQENMPDCEVQMIAGQKEIVEDFLDSQEFGFAIIHVDNNHWIAIAPQPNNKNHPYVELDSNKEEPKNLTKEEAEIIIRKHALIFVRKKNPNFSMVPDRVEALLNDKTKPALKPTAEHLTKEWLQKHPDAKIRLTIRYPDGEITKECVVGRVDTEKSTVRLRFLRATTGNPSQLTYITCTIDDLRKWNLPLRDQLRRSPLSPPESKEQKPEEFHELTEEDLQPGNIEKLLAGQKIRFIYKDTDGTFHEAEGMVGEVHADKGYMRITYKFAKERGTATHVGSLPLFLKDSEKRMFAWDYTPTSGEVIRFGEQNEKDPKKPKNAGTKGNKKQGGGKRKT